jgi:citrate lyase subunit beta/citryl-CoA lyase
MSKKPLITLYAPGNRKDLIDKVPRFAPDGVVFDLEDAVPVQLKESVRNDLVQIIPGYPLIALVRVNSDAKFLEGDLRTVVCTGLYGIILPMVETPEQVKYADAVISETERDKKLPPGSVKLFLLIETPLGVRNCYDVCVASPRVESIVYGSAEDGDLQAELKSAFSIEGYELMYPRQKSLLDARAAKLPYVLDGAYSSVKNEAGLRADCTVSKRLGFNGRTLIYPGHIGPAREVYQPAAKEVAHYKQLVVEFEKAVAAGKAAVVYNDNMIDYAMFKRAKLFLANADLYEG